MVRMGYGPDGFEAANMSLLSIIQEAYGVQANQIIGAPEWVNTSAYDIDVKMEGSSTNTQETDPRLRQPEIRNQLQALLADRFKLTLHRATKSFHLMCWWSGKTAPSSRRQNLQITLTPP